jgi:hypothetical protein
MSQRNEQVIDSALFLLMKVPCRFNYSCGILNATDNPLLLGQRWEGNLVAQHMRRANCGVVRRPLRCDLIAKVMCPDVVAKEATIELLLVNLEEEVVAADNSPVEILRDDAEATLLGINLGHLEISGPA